MNALSFKHIAPCPLCDFHSFGCRGHTIEAWTADRRRREQEQVRGTQEWRALNRKKREALRTGMRM